ncbi:MAG: hypothetical protein LUQ64_00820 [Methanomicrobiales archaeon]|nr:hypothetical protein [Methanomicrobiales archaeon]
MRALRPAFLGHIRGHTLRGIAERSWKDPLYRHSLILTASRFLNAAVIGFLFWTIAAHQYPVAEVGIGTALISATSLLVSLAMLGFDVAVIRFTPLRDPGEVFSISVWVTTAAAAILAVIFLLLVPVVMPPIAMVRDYWLLFLAIVPLTSFSFILGRTFIAHRRPHLLFLQYLVTAVRLPLLYPLVFLGGLGIFLAAGVSTFLAAAFSLVAALGFVRLTFGIRREVLRDMYRFSSANYVSTLLADIPELVLPLIVLALLGPVAAAQYFIAFAIATLILVIPDAIGTSYFVEGSYGSADPRKEAMRALAVSTLVLLPITAGVLLFGRSLLGFFGPAYALAYPLLLILTLSSFLVAFHKICIPFLNIHMRIGVIVGVNALRMILLLGLSLLAIPLFGIEGAGYAWILTHAMIAVPLVWLLWRQPPAGTAAGTGEGA